jgi:BirA family biotin operon repressor/biotin-[acetyl-CoA-carboxylase] ligase
VKKKYNESFNLCKSIKYYKKIESTQIIAKKFAKKGFDEGVVVIAKSQTNGYGRNKKKWFSNDGGVWLSILLRPMIYINDVSKLTFLFSIVLIRIFKKKYKINPKIKWPNDIFVFEKKIAGIITETSITQGKTDWIVVGVGVNINNSIPKFLKNVSISLKDILKKKVDISEFIFDFFFELEHMYFDFKKNGFTKFLEEYNNKIMYKNRNIIVNDDQCNVVIGKNLGIDEDGCLIVKTKIQLIKILHGSIINDKKTKEYFFDEWRRKNGIVQNGKRCNWNEK